LGILLIHSGPFSVRGETAEITVPPEFGRIESGPSSGKAGAPLVVLIQDAHAHYEAQRSLAEILRHLVLQHGLEWVLVEGGAGDIDLSELSRGVPPVHAQQVAESYLKSGKISGEEFLDMTLTDHELRLWGLENPALYRQNVEAYFEFYKEQEAALKTIWSLLERAEELRKKHYPPVFYEFETLKAQSETREISTLAYFNVLADQAKREGISFEPFPVFREWLALREKETGLDSAKLELEKKEITQALSRSLTKEELHPLLGEWRSSGFGFETALLKTILDYKREYQPKFDRYSTEQIEKAVRLTEEAGRLKGGELFKESEAIYRELRSRVLPEGRPREAADLFDFLKLTETLFRLEWTPEDLEDYEALEARLNFESAAELLRPLGGLEKVRESAARAKRFYEAARDREEALFGNALRKIEEEKKKVYAVLTGGFHTKELAGRFGSAGVPVVIVRPRFQVTGEPSAAFQILREKWGEGKSVS
jgi:hypothetical protein